MKKVIRLNENDLSRIVRRVMNEGAGFVTYYKSTDGTKEIQVGCFGSGNSYIEKYGKKSTMTDDMRAVICAGK